MTRLPWPVILGLDVLLLHIRISAHMTMFLLTKGSRISLVYLGALGSTDSCFSFPSTPICLPIYPLSFVSPLLFHISIPRTWYFFFFFFPAAQRPLRDCWDLWIAFRRPFFCVSPIHLMTSPSLPFNVRYGFRMEISEASFTRADFSMYSFSAVAKRS